MIYRFVKEHGVNRIELKTEAESDIFKLGILVDKLEGIGLWYEYKEVIAKQKLYMILTFDFNDFLMSLMDDILQKDTYYEQK